MIEKINVINIRLIINGQERREYGRFSDTGSGQHSEIIELPSADHLVGNQFDPQFTEVVEM